VKSRVDNGRRSAEGAIRRRKRGKGEKRGRSERKKKGKTPP
jgi:hypothetical protein